MFAPCSRLKAVTRNISLTANSGTIARSAGNPRESVILYILYRSQDVEFFSWGVWTRLCFHLWNLFCGVDRSLQSDFNPAGVCGRRNVPLRRCPHLLYNLWRRKGSGLAEPSVSVYLRVLNSAERPEGFLWSTQTAAFNVLIGFISLLYAETQRSSRQFCGTMERRVRQRVLTVNSSHVDTRSRPHGVAF